MSSDQRLRVPGAHVISESFDGEAVVINLETGVYYSLGGAAGDVWEGVREGWTRSRLVGGLEHRYQAEPGRIARSVDALLDRMESEQLLVRDQAEADGRPADEGAGSAAARLPFVEPRLERFTDIQDLLLLDPVHEVDDRGWPHQERAGEAHPSNRE